jgi:hypothetical protein
VDSPVLLRKDLAAPVGQAAVARGEAAGGKDSHSKVAARFLVDSPAAVVARVEAAE